MSNKIETKTYMSNEWIRNIKLKIKKFEKYNKNRSNLYKILNYNEEELIKIELKMIQSIRILYLYVNKTKYDIFNYDTLRLWKIVSKKKIIL